MKAVLDPRDKTHRSPTPPKSLMLMSLRLEIVGICDNVAVHLMCAHWEIAVVGLGRRDLSSKVLPSSESDRELAARAIDGYRIANIPRIG